MFKGKMVEKPITVKIHSYFPLTISILGATRERA